MRMHIEQLVAGRWRYCAKCGKDKHSRKIRKGELYYLEWLNLGYNNFCVACAIEEFQDRIEFLEKKLKSIKIYTKVKEKSND